jgi:hypothetical protein
MYEIVNTQQWPTKVAPNGRNYLSWFLYVEIVMDGKSIQHAI